MVSIFFYGNMNYKSQRRRKRFQRDSKVRLKLTGRDQEIINWVYQHRLLSSEHISSLVQGSKQGILRRLKLLFHAGYLDRPKRQIAAFGNNYPLVYGLGNKGANLLASEFDLPVETVNWYRKNRDAKEIFLEHTLMVSRILTTFRLACQDKNNVEFIEPEQLIINRRKPPTLKTHALSWRVNTKKGEFGQSRCFSFNMIPDSLFGLRIKKGNRIRETYFFLEADRATMPIKRTNFFRSSFYKKMVGYIASYKKELYSEYFGFKKLRILTVTKSDDRIKNMIQVNKILHEKGNGYNLFLFTKNELINIEKSGNLFGQIWINGRGEKTIIQ